MDDLGVAIDQIADGTGFSGVVRVDRAGAAVARAFGWADRGHRVANTVDTRFAIASGTKSITALVVMSLVAAGRVALATTARSLLGADLPEIGDGVTVEHLLAHRSGIGDYLDEDGWEPNDYMLPVPGHRLARTEDYLVVLDGRPAKFAPGTAFSYCNSGYVVLALLAERATGDPFATLVHDRVGAPAGLTATGFVRSDEVPGDAAIGYLDEDGLRTNVLHMPALGSGDGGLYSTAADIHALWAAIDSGRIVPPALRDEMWRPHSEVRVGELHYGLGFWLPEPAGTVMLEGADAGISFRSVHSPARQLTCTVLSNTTEGAWAMSRAVLARLTD